MERFSKNGGATHEQAEKIAGQARIRGRSHTRSHLHRNRRDLVARRGVSRRVFVDGVRVMYKLEQYVDGEWWTWGTYKTAQALAESAFELGRMRGVRTNIRVTEVQE